jgi:hypothetical protein
MNYSICINTATVFKQKWYLEGMARWMENAFRPAQERVFAAGEPSLREQFLAAIGRPPLGQLCAAFAANKTAGNALAYRYVDGSPVFQTWFCPAARCWRLFQQLALTSEGISRAMKRANDRWSEQQQRDGQFNSLICQALSNAAQR